MMLLTLLLRYAYAFSSSFFVVYDLHLLLTLPDLLLQGFCRAFKLEIAVAGPTVVAATGQGSSARFITGLFGGQHSYVEYVPDPRIA